ncbi:T9SS type A sorting domain-containing protein [candidate division WOR-3 bacterium]|nr:T9SS type A sorting domain-containing protein [candidate division WOR-3 bacterium]
MTPTGISLDSIIICDDLYDQVAPSVSFGDNIYLVSWCDKRGEFPAIYCARLLPDGSVLDEDGFLVHLDTMKQINPISAFDGSNFFVVWSAFDVNGFGIYGKRISPEGNILDSFPITISFGTDSKYMPDISFDGYNYMVIWNDARLTGSESSDQWAARVTPEGVLLDTNGIPVDTQGGYQFNSSISFLNPYYLAAWTDDKSGSPDIFGKRISPLGTVIDASSIPICTQTGYQEGAACFPGVENFLVAWKDGRDGFENTDIYATFIDTAGAGIAEGVQPATYSDKISLIIFPNPFSTSTTINFSGAQEIQIYDVSGRLVKNFILYPSSPLENASLTGQTFILPAKLEWDGMDDEGKNVSPGIYFCILRHGGMKVREKVLLIR